MNPSNNLPTNSLPPGTPPKPKTSALGKGLASLIPGVLVNQAAAPASNPFTQTTQSAPTIGVPAGEPLYLEIQKIKVNPFQPRKDFEQKALEELSSSIKTLGILQPLTVRKTPEGYELIAGERRLRAARMAGLSKVPVIVRASTTNKESLELALIENIQREELNCIDEAIAYFQLIDDFGLTQEEVAIRVSKDRASIANHIRLLRLPDLIVQDLRAQKISFGHGKVLLSLESREDQLKAHAAIIQQGLSVRALENHVAALSALSPKVQKPKGAPSAIQGRLGHLGIELSKLWSSRVMIKGNDKSGRIVFQYKNREELERLLERMQNHGS